MKLGRAHLIILLLVIAGAAVCVGLIIHSSGSVDRSQEYGVFIGFEGKLEELAEYETIVIDAQYYAPDEIAAFKEKGHTIYSYINIGALESFRDYFDRYKDMALGEYEHWDEEVWMGVSDPAWRDFIIEELAPELVDEGRLVLLTNGFVKKTQKTPEQEINLAKTYRADYYARKERK